MSWHKNSSSLQQENSSPSFHLNLMRRRTLASAYGFHFHWYRLSQHFLYFSHSFWFFSIDYKKIYVSEMQFSHAVVYSQNFAENGEDSSFKHCLNQFPLWENFLWLWRERYTYQYHTFYLNFKTTPHKKKCCNMHMLLWLYLIIISVFFSCFLNV